MRFLLLIILLMLSSLSCKAQAQQDKEDLIVAVIESANDYSGIRDVLKIIKKYKNIYKYIPTFCPINEKYRISSNYGYRQHPILQKKQFHSGLDMAAQYAAIIYSAADGQVTYANTKGGYGKMIEITHKFGFISRYGHLTYIYAQNGKIVKKGEPIGFVGSTGRSTGNHLHFEIIKNNKKINPQPFIK